MNHDPLVKFIHWMCGVITVYPAYAGDLIIALLFTLILVSFGKWPTFQFKKRPVVSRRHRERWSRPPVT